VRHLAAPTCALLLLTGCAAERTLRVTSEPPGAIVRLDGEAVGTTPCEIPFAHYGIRRITLYKEGYRTESEAVELDPPWYARFPVDIVSEVFLPIGWRDRRKYHVDLIEGEDVLGAPTLRSVIERAGVLRHAGPEGPQNLPDPEPAELPEIDEDGP
jgi:hypothetical protein